jgi:colicin import membrane protein
MRQNSFQRRAFLSLKRRDRNSGRSFGESIMNKSVLLGAAVVVAAGLGYYQLSYVPAQKAAEEAAMKASEEIKAAEAAAEEAAAKAAEEAQAAETAAAAAAEEAALKVAEEAKALEEAAAEAAKAAEDAATEAANSTTEEVKAAEEAAAKAAEEASLVAAEEAAKVEAEAKAVADAAEQAAADAAAAAADATTAAADALDPSQLLDADNFDSVRVAALIDASPLDDAVKTTLKSAVSAASANPLLLQGALDQVKAALGL